MDKAERWVWFCGFLLACAASVYFFFNSKLLLEQLKVQTNSSALVSEKSPRPDSLDLGKFDIGVMMEMGLKSPVSNLAADLVLHPELIPFEAPLGGKFDFYNPAGFVVLNSRWVYAPVDDGHNRGYMLLEYHVAKGGKIEWKVVSAYSDFE